jgi:GH15 family glucan-1,4-alpha-glucosidase
VTSSAPIQDYAPIGNGRSLALVSRFGSIDWLCWPRFDSPSIFARLLDTHAGGSWSIHPTAPCGADRRYLEDTNVLETRFTTDQGTIVLTDLMTIAGERDRARFLLPENEIVRRLVCLDGEVETEMIYDPRPEYGRYRVAIENAGVLGIRIDMGSHLLSLRSEVDLNAFENGAVGARMRLRAGQTIHFSLTHSEEAPAVLPPLGEFTEEAITRSVEWWKRWAKRASYQGRHRDAIVRSALALKLLSFAPSGAIIAAPTTSLPEKIGGDLNYDYRFCWVRDAALTTRALFGLGYREEAEAFVSWLLHATRLTRPELRILYDVYGELPAEETTLSHLEGYAGSRPVRLRNGARNQIQLDSYGEVIDATAQLVHAGGHLDRESQSMLVAYGDYVCQHWQQPDNGIWEEPKRAHHTHSRVFCWTALDRLLELHCCGAIQKLPDERFRANRDQIRREIEERAWNRELQSYTRFLDGDSVDASLLLMAWCGFEDPASDRMQKTFECIRRRLTAGPGLVYRYEDSVQKREGAFGICSFWIAEFLARQGRVDEGWRWFEETLKYANDVGVFAEEIDPRTGAALGNFPQAFTHIGLINAALSLMEEKQIDDDTSPRRQIAILAAIKGREA